MDTMRQIATHDEGRDVKGEGVQERGIHVMNDDGHDKTELARKAGPAGPNTEEDKEPGGFSLGHTRRSSAAGFEHLVEQVTTPLYQRKEVTGPSNGLPGQNASDR